MYMIIHSHVYADRLNIVCQPDATSTLVKVPDKHPGMLIYFQENVTLFRPYLDTCQNLKGKLFYSTGIRLG